VNTSRPPSSNTSAGALVGAVAGAGCAIAIDALDAMMTTTTSAYAKMNVRRRMERMQQCRPPRGVVRRPLAKPRAAKTRAAHFGARR
jgi:hypothetical protein